MLLRTYWDALDLFDTTDKESPVPLIEDDGSNLSTRCRAARTSTGASERMERVEARVPRTSHPGRG